MNNLDKQYQALLQYILDNGTRKGDRTGTGTIAVFGRTIRHNMSEGFPLLTTKKMFSKGVFTELIWLLRGDTNIQWLVKNGCNIWTGDAYKKYQVEDAKVMPNMSDDKLKENGFRLTKDEFTERIKTDDEFAKKWGDLGPIYGKQWRNWGDSTEYISLRNGGEHKLYTAGVDQISKMLDRLLTHPDCRRNMVNAWKVDEIDEMTLPPCHYGFQVFTRELSLDERVELWYQKNQKQTGDRGLWEIDYVDDYDGHKKLNSHNIPKRAVSLMWNQRSVDTFLGLPFNIASYGALLMIIGKLTNMVPEELIGILADTHLYSNHVDQAKEQIGKGVNIRDRYKWCTEQENYNPEDFAHLDTENESGKLDMTTLMEWLKVLDAYGAPEHTRIPFPLPKLELDTTDWGGDNWSEIIDNIKVSDFKLSGYKSHGKIIGELSN